MVTYLHGLSRTHYICTTIYPSTREHLRFMILSKGRNQESTDFNWWLGIKE